MSWEDEVFAVLDDLEQQAESLYDAERAVELADRARSEYAEVTLRSRLAASLGEELRLDVRGVGELAGRLERVADGWLLVRVVRQDWVVVESALLLVEGASPRALPAVAWPVTARLGLGSALRRLADSGQRCLLHLVDGTRHEGALVRVGADFVEVRDAASGRTRLVTQWAIAAVQSHEG